MSAYLPLLARFQSLYYLRKEEEKQLMLGQGENILIVDDEDIVRVLLERLVKRFGYNAMTARDGQEALDLYEVHNDTIDVIILDLIMPKLSGEC